MMEYKGYVAAVKFDDEANVFLGEVINTRDVITFQGKCVDDLRKEFVASVEDYLAFCAERNEKPEKPFSGAFTLRMDPRLHQKATIEARRAGVSLNQWVNKLIEKQFS